MDPIVVELTSRIEAPADAVWQRVTSPAGIRHELRPVLGMTMPPGLRGASIADAEAVVGRPLGRAWLLLLGVLPVDYDDMRLVEVVPGRRFHESSTMLTLSRWEHERTIVPTGETSCEVRDRLTAVPRALGGVGVVRRVVTALVTALFRHRHRRLRAWAVPA